MAPLSQPCSTSKLLKRKLIAVKVFDRTLATNRDTVIRAIDWCLQNEIDIINLSLGTANPPTASV